jgi:hypothetical protein
VRRGWAAVLGSDEPLHRVPAATPVEREPVPSEASAG